jgi:putative transposase
MNGIDWTRIEQKELEAFERRLALVETVLDDSIDEYQRLQVRRAYCQEHGVSERTIRNYIRRYREEGQHGLLFYRNRSTNPTCPRDRK